MPAWMVLTMEPALQPATPRIPVVIAKRETPAAGSRMVLSTKPSNAVSLSCRTDWVNNEGVGEPFKTRRLGEDIALRATKRHGPSGDV